MLTSLASDLAKGQSGPIRYKFIRRLVVVVVVVVAVAVVVVVPVSDK